MGFLFKNSSDEPVQMKSFAKKLQEIRFWYETL